MTPSPPTGRSPERVRLGVAGLGVVAQAVHLPLIERLRDMFEVSAIADLSPTLTAAIGDRYDVAPDRRFGTVDDLLEAGRIDGLAVLTSGSHGPQVEAALDAGLPVFAEKPLAFTLAEMDAIDRRLGGSQTARLQLGYMKLYDPAVMHALAVAEGRGFGTPRAIEVTVLHPSSASQLAHARLLSSPAHFAGEPSAIAEATDRLRGAALGEAAATAFGALYTDILLGSVVHELSLVRAFAGDPTAIDSLSVWPDGAWPPSLELTGRLRSDGRVSIRWHYLADYAAYREIVRVVYEAVTIELEFPSPYLLHRPTILRITSPDHGGRLDEVRTSIVEAFETQLLAFHAMVTAGRTPAAGAAEGRADILTCQRSIAVLAAARGVAIGGEAAASRT